MKHFITNSFTYRGHQYDHKGSLMMDMVRRLAYVLSRSRSWHRREQERSDLHPAVLDLLNMYPVKDWHALVLEWPHISKKDQNKIAYTRSVEHGEIDRQTVTSIGKYLTRHFIYTPSDLIRDAVSKHGSTNYTILRDMDEILTVMLSGAAPASCMTKFSKPERHPYSVYDPALGWGLAVRKDGHGEVSGRALVWDDPNDADRHIFVRTYAKATNSAGYSQADDGLKAWLVEQGYRRESAWYGASFRYIPHPSGYSDFMMPYIDGDCQTVTVDQRANLVYLDEDGDYTCSNTDGTVTSNDRTDCECCGDSFHEEDMHWVGRYDDTHVCGYCFDNSYISAVSRNGDTYYIHHDDAIWVESCDQHYDVEHLERNGIIELDNGDYEHRNNAVYLDYRDMWVHMDDDCVVYCEHSSEYEHVDDCVRLENDEWALRDDAWQCEHSDNWYLSDDVTSVTTPCGKEVHPDYADEYVTEEESEGE